MEIKEEKDKGKEAKDRDRSKHARTVLVLEVVKDQAFNFDLNYLANYFDNWIKSILVIFFLVGSFNANSDVLSLVLLQDSKLGTKSSQMESCYFLIEDLWQLVD